MSGEIDRVGDISMGCSSKSVEWKIPRFFSLSPQADYELNSPFFHFHCGTWFLTMYPNGHSTCHSEGYIGLFLMREKSDIPKQRIQYRLEIRTKDDTKLKIFIWESDFKEGMPGVGFSHFIARSELLKKLDPEGTLIVSCDLFAGKPEAATQIESHKHVNKLGEDLKNLFLSGDESDLTLSVGGRELKCHKAVLIAQSPVFRAMLKQEVDVGEDKLERVKRVLEIKDCEPEVFQEFLIYLYSGSMEDFTEKNALGLYRLAHRYDVPEVKAKCLYLLNNGLCVTNFCDVFDLMLQHSELDMLRVVARFFAKNIQRILVTHSWKNFLRKNPDAVNELLLEFSYEVIPD